MKISVAIDKYFTIFLYVSLAFLVFFLFRYDYARIDLVRFDFVFLTSSLLLLFLGFWLNAYCWYLTCMQLAGKVSLSEAVVSHGLSIFGKYIPGKVWGILGRAGYVSRTGVSLSSATQASFYAQVMSIWAGLVLGFVGLVAIGIGGHYVWIIGILMVVCTAFLFSPPQNSRLVKRLIFRGPYGGVESVFRLDSQRVIPLAFVFLLFWLCWTTGFLLFVQSLFPGMSFKWYLSLAFPFAATVGILAFIFPGGLGIREGLLVFFLVNCGMPAENAAVTSILSRIWFSAGEVFIFLTALFLRINASKKLAYHGH
ncbi:MAG: flippase-like domain-containing protein [Deltaproteobacteria bacterium]|nr:flippase-like domain-containing protein [Deltaproteobacteria bacterium]